MGTITIVQPDGHEDRWVGRKPRNIAEQMHRFKQSIIKHLRADPEVRDQYIGFTDDDMVGGYVFQMACYALATPMPDNDDVRVWRQMLILNLMLGTESTDPDYPGKLYEYLPDHDINVRVHGIVPEGIKFEPGDQPTGIDMSVQIVPIGQDITPMDTSHRMMMVPT